MTKDDAKKNPLRLVVAPRMREYLTWLSENTLLGASENDVARYLLTKTLEEMRQADYREEELP